jgi:hypothetical protein
MNANMAFLETHGHQSRVVFLATNNAEGAEKSSLLENQSIRLHPNWRMVGI